MKNLSLLSILTIFIFLLSFPSSFAQEYTRWHLPEGATARYGKGSIRTLAYFPDGTRLAVRSSIGIWIYDTRTGEELDLLTGDRWDISAMALSPDGKTVAVASGRNIILRDPLTGDEKNVLAGHTANVYSLIFSPTGAFSPDGQTLASGSYKKIYISDLATGKHTATLAGHSNWIESVAFSPDGQTLASGSDDCSAGAIMGFDIFSKSKPKMIKISPISTNLRHITPPRCKAPESKFEFFG